MNVICWLIGHHWRLRYIDLAVVTVCERCGQLRVSAMRAIR